MKLSVSRIVGRLIGWLMILFIVLNHYADWNDFFYIFILF